MGLHGLPRLTPEFWIGRYCGSEEMGLHGLLRFTPAPLTKGVWGVLSAGCRLIFSIDMFQEPVPMENFAIRPSSRERRPGNTGISPA